MGRYDGQLLDAAESLHNRLLSLYQDPRDDRLLAATDDYFFRSTVFRFMAFFRLAVGLEQAALYLDPKVASKRDRLALRYVKALRWSMTDRELFKGLSPTATDHFHGDRFRALCTVAVPAGETFDFGFFEANVVGQARYRPLFDYFDGLAPNGAPLRWDRVVVMHLLLMAYMQTAGFDDMHRFEQADLARVAGRLRSPEVRAQFETWFLPEMKLHQDKQAKRVIKALHA
jgi:hypothetical protein